MRILLTGGGSGGHIYPLLATIEKLKDRAKEKNIELELRYFGDPEQYELELRSAGARIVYITGSKLRQYFSLLNIVDIFKFFWSIPQALIKVFWYMPDVAFGKGGPGALAVLLACRWYRIPIIIHDSDAIPGRTTLLSQNAAKKIELAFPSAVEYFKNPEKTNVVGQPIRFGIERTANELDPTIKEHTKKMLSFDIYAPLLMIIGGSQGATALNNFVLENIEALIDKYQIIHQVGVENFKEYQTVFLELAKKWSAPRRTRYQPVPFLQQDLKTAYLASDLIIGRAGAGVIFETAALGKASILVPLPTAASDHQRENAYQYAHAGACIVVEEENLIGNIMINTIDSILNNPENLKKLEENAKKFYKPNAALAIADDIIELGANSL